MTERSERSYLQRPGPLLFGIGVLVLSAISFYGIAQIPVSVFGGPVGPRTFPLLVTTGLFICGVCLVWASLRGQFEVAVSERLDWLACRSSLWWFFGGLAANLVLIAPIGFILSSAAMFPLVARAFGDQRLTRNAIIGGLFAALVYFPFRLVLGVNIGLGVFGIVGGWGGIE
ncbi:tripartite tricarboxylate transporter TctB family protein [Rhizobium puerariae]|uniref:Tripartite tricarboxylate transporter TctB family protein n=1 Tax=Rhizobium puerariae TaxID=1585791 RepID=A0ABV6ARM6_9HYPH